MIKEGKTRVMITLDNTLLELAKQLAIAEQRTLSQEIAYLLTKGIENKSL